ncbi:MAG TPA: hypothetical protein VIJ93_10665, partial [bacterium]
MFPHLKRPNWSFFLCPRRVTVVDNIGILRPYSLYESTDDPADKGRHGHRKNPSQGNPQRSTAQRRPTEMPPQCAKTREARQRERRDRGDTQEGWRNEKAGDGDHGEDREAGGRYPGRLKRAGKGPLL